MPVYIFDDVYGDQRPGSTSPRALYEPQWGGWDPVGGTCWGCTLGTNLPVPIDPTKAAMGTWHTVTVKQGYAPANVSVTFIGTSISAYCILPPNVTFPHLTINSTLLSFTLDGANAGSFEWIGTTDQWTYNQSVFSRVGLAQREHTFVMSPQNRGSMLSYMVLDYLTYQFEDATATVGSATQTTPTAAQPQPSRSTSLSGSAGVRTVISPAAAACSGFAVSLALCLMVLSAFWYIRRRRLEARTGRVSPYHLPHPRSIFESPIQEAEPTHPPSALHSRSLTDASRIRTDTRSSAAHSIAVPRLLTMPEYLAQRQADLDRKRAMRGA